MTEKTPASMVHIVDMTDAELHAVAEYHRKRGQSQTADNLPRLKPVLRKLTEDDRARLRLLSTTALQVELSKLVRAHERGE